MEVIIGILIIGAIVAIPIIWLYGLYFYKEYIFKKIKYKTTETSTYNKLIGAKYFDEPIFYGSGSNIFCTNIYYDFDYFKSFETYTDSEVISLKNMINSFSYSNYLQELKQYNSKKDNLLFYFRFYTNKKQSNRNRWTY